MEENKNTEEISEKNEESSTQYTESVENNEDTDNEENVIPPKRYSIPLEMFEKAYTVFQKKYVYPRNITMCILLLFLAVLNVISIVLGHGSTFGYVLVFACVALAFVNLYNPHKIKKNLIQALEGLDEDVYTLDVLPDKLIIGTVIDPQEYSDSEPEEYEKVFGDVKKAEDIENSEIYLNSSLRVTERAEFFLVYIKKSMFYVIPKSSFTDEEIKTFALYFSQKIGSHFSCEADV